MLISGVVKTLQVERGLSALYLSNTKNQAARDSMLNARSRTDAATQQVDDWSRVEFDVGTV